MLVTLLVSHFEMSALNDSFNSKSLLMSVTLLVSQFSISSKFFLAIRARSVLLSNGFVDLFLFLDTNIVAMMLISGGVRRKK